MFVIRSGEKMWGPFKTAGDAVKWALKELDPTAVWVIARIMKPF